MASYVQRKLQCEAKSAVPPALEIELCNLSLVSSLPQDKCVFVSYSPLVDDIWLTPETSCVIKRVIE